MGDFLDGYTRGMTKVGEGTSYVDAGLMSASDPAAYAGPAGEEGYDIPYADWMAFCNAIGNDDTLLVPSASGKPPVGAVTGGFGGDGAYETWFRVSGGRVTQVLVAFCEEYEEWEDEAQEDCPQCGGSGVVGDDDEECPKCDGAGYVMEPYDENNGGCTFKGDFGNPAYFEVSSGYLVVSDPCYVLTPDNSNHPASLDAVASALGGEAVRNMGGLYYCRAAEGRWVARVAQADGLVGAVLFEKA